MAAVERYLFVFSDGSSHKLDCGISLKDAIWEMSVHIGTANELLRLSMTGFENNDRRLVDLYNRLISYRTRTGVFRITGVYTIAAELYSEDMAMPTRDASNASDDHLPYSHGLKNYLDRLSSAVDEISDEELHSQV